MGQVEKLWKQIKSESAKSNPNRERIDRLKQEMTRKAKVFLRKKYKSGLNVLQLALFYLAFYRIDGIITSVLYL